MLTLPENYEAKEEDSMNIIETFPREEALQLDTEQFTARIAAEQRHKDVLILRKLDEPRRPLSGPLCQYELEHRWLSDPRHLTCVQGADFTLWATDEIDLRKGLFVQFRLF